MNDTCNSDRAYYVFTHTSIRCHKFLPSTHQIYRWQLCTMGARL